MDINSFYPENQMDRAEYIMIHIYIIPQEFEVKYNINDKVRNGYIFTQITKGMYVLPKEVRISHDSLVQHLEPYG